MLAAPFCLQHDIGVVRSDLLEDIMKCVVCKPFCDNCSPAAMRNVFCPDCNQLNLFSRLQVVGPDELRCKKCGRDLSDIAIKAPVMCLAIGSKLCADPCKRADRVSESGYVYPCIYHISPQMMGHYVESEPLAVDSGVCLTD